MTGFYIYASKSKVDVLESSLARDNPFKGLGLKITTPMVEVSADLKSDKSFQKSLAKVRKKLMGQDIRPFDDESAPPGPIMSFTGEVGLTVSQGAMLGALAAGKTALLLVGSARNLTGAADVPDAGLAPVSMVPVSAIPNEDGLSDNRAISNRWQQVWRKAPAGTKVRVTGFALFSGAYAASRAEMRRAGHPEVTRLILASPVYVEQI